QRVAVGRRIDHGLDRDIAAGAGPVLDHHRLGEALREPWCHDPRHDIGAAAGRKADHEAQRAQRVGLCECAARDRRRCGCRCSEMQKSSAREEHRGLPAGRCRRTNRTGQRATAATQVYIMCRLCRRERGGWWEQRSFRVAERRRPIHIRSMTMTLTHPGEAGRFDSDDARWEAVRQRDRTADGAFFCAVVTTGVYCRPSCPARPRRENVRFYASSAEAVRAGFRACRRCRPDEAIPMARSPRVSTPSTSAIAERVAALDWTTIAAELDARGCATSGVLLMRAETAALTATYDNDALFRSRIVMARHGFGRGEYKYFAYPLPDDIAALRTSLYPPLAAIANRWNEAMGIEPRYPDAHEAFLARCHAAGQTKPTP